MDTSKRREAKRRWIEKRIASGYCIRCTKNMAIEGKKSCQGCLEYAATRQQEARRVDPERFRLAGKTQRRKEHKEIVEAYGGRCVCCGEDRLPFLEIDHIDGNGRAHRKTVVPKSPWGGTPFYRALRVQGYPDCGLQVLCANCHAAKTRGFTCPCSESEE